MKMPHAEHDRPIRNPHIVPYYGRCLCQNKLSHNFINYGKNYEYTPTQNRVAGERENINPIRLSLFLAPSMVIGGRFRPKAC